MRAGDAAAARLGTHELFASSGVVRAHGWFPHDDIMRSSNGRLGCHRVLQI